MINILGVIKLFYRYTIFRSHNLQFQVSVSGFHQLCIYISCNFVLTTFYSLELEDRLMPVYHVYHMSLFCEAIRLY